MQNDITPLTNILSSLDFDQDPADVASQYFLVNKDIKNSLGSFTIGANYFMKSLIKSSKRRLNE